jgi:flagellar assembly protein FliH
MKAVVNLELRDFETEARRVVDHARHAAGELIEAAEARCGEIESLAHERGRIQGWRDGFAHGDAEGKQDAVKRGEEELRLLLETLRAATQAVQAERQAIESAAIPEAVELAIAIAERITRRLGVVDPRVLLENVRAALKLTARNVPVMRIMIHPSQGATLKAALASLQLEWPQLAAAEIIEDGSILPGGCRVETVQGGVDADLRTQLDRIADRLLPQEQGCEGGAL